MLIEVQAAAAGRDGDASGETIRKFAEALPEAAILAMGSGVSAEAVIKVIRAGAFEFLPGPWSAPTSRRRSRRLLACGGDRRRTLARRAA